MKHTTTTDFDLGSSYSWEIPGERHHQGGGSSFFDPDLFRIMLDDPAQRASFRARHPEATGLFEEYLESSKPTYPDFPSDGITAIQFTLFNNGEAEPRPSKAVRPRTRKGPQITKAQFGLTAKAWTRLNIDLSKERYVAWKASAFLWSPEHADVLADDLLAREKITPETRARLASIIKVTDGDGHYGLFAQKEHGCGTRYPGQVLYVRLADGRPESAILIVNDSHGYSANSFEPTTARGNDLGGKAISQARVAYHDKWNGWATEKGDGSIS